MAKRKTARTTPDDAVTAYARDVIERREVAGPLVRLACERHLRDLKEAKARGLVWDVAAVERVFGYFHDVLTLPSGERFELHPSQQFIVGSLFGWKLKNGTRRYRVAYIEMGKGNGKSPTAAGIGLYMLTADGEEAGQVYSAAVDKDQAKVSFQFAVGFVNKSTLLSGAITKSGGKYGDETRVHNLFHRKSGSYFRPLSSESRGKGKSGFLPHCVLLDELHEHPSDAMVEFVRANTKGRAQPLVLMITNSGVYDQTSVAWRYHHYAEEVLNGVRDDDEFFFYVCGLDRDDLWSNPACWKKANPLLGVSIPERYLEQQVREATGMPSKQSVVRRLNFCEWVESSDPFVDPIVWQANRGAPDRDELRGASCYGGLDLSGKNALTSLVLVFEADAAGNRAVLPFFWTPEDGIAERAHQDKAPYAQWIADGYLTTTPGSTIDYAFVARQLGELTERYNIQAIAFDRWRFEDLRRELDAAGVDITLVECSQGFRDMDPAIEALEDALLAKQLGHGNHPVLTWCVNNVRVEKNATNLRMFSKRKATGRIDGAVALAMACGVASSHAGVSSGSYAVTVI